MSAFYIHIKKIVLTVIAIQVLNIGLFAQDVEQYNTSIHQANDVVNSVTEYVAEVLLNKEHNLPDKTKSNSHEHHKSSSNTHIKTTHFKLAIQKSYTNTNAFCQVVYQQYSITNFIENLPTIIFDITPPPPKA